MVEDGKDAERTVLVWARIEISLPTAPQVTQMDQKNLLLVTSTVDTLKFYQ